MSSNMFNQFRRGNASAPADNGAEPPADIYRSRNNYMTMANVTEMATLIISGVIDDQKGISGTVGGNKLTKSDISDLVVTRVMGSVGAVVGEGK